MSKEFIEAKVGSISLEKAVRQHKQLAYFLTSEIQEDVRNDYFEKYIERKYYTNDVFHNWVKSIFNDTNFLSFAKYYRNPNPSSKLINTRIAEPLSRVFFSEDAYFNYIIQGNSVEYPPELDDGFQEKLFDSVLYRHNDVIIHDLKDINSPYREFVSIERIVAIKVEDDLIQKVAYSGEVLHNGKIEVGYLYLDDTYYAFYNRDIDLVFEVEHDFGQCPATFVVKEDFDNDPIVKKSVFSYLRGDLEEYSFLKTLQRMTDANGAIPIVTKLKTKELTESGYDFDQAQGEPMSIQQIGSKTSSEARATAGNGKGSVLQPGTIIEVPPIEKADGSIDMELAKNFLTFYYTPVEALEYLSTRIKELESNIVTSAIGDYSEGNEASMNELQVSKSYVSKEDKLRWLSNTLSFSRSLSDNMMLSLKYGKGEVNVDIFYGSDFFLETQDKLYDMFAKCPNSIERTNILIRLSQRRNMFNREKSKREVILYKLLPYSADIDFNTAIDRGNIDSLVFEFQTRFSYWVAVFESFYGDMSVFWNSIDMSDSGKIVLLNNLIYNLIQTTNGKETSN